MKLLITGAAGFIGYHLCRSMLKEGYEILGIDNLNDYYDKKLKSGRLDILKKHKNFRFEKIDISERQKLTNSFIKFKPNKVVNLAAQAGVRYSLENPYIYIDSNISGFLNLIELSRQYDVEGFIYASSSSVYGANKKTPFSIDDRTDNPVSLYAATKKSNELIANSYFNLYGLRNTGLRFFTVYGPWGRPDMAYYIFTKKIFLGKTIDVYNNGKMERDFTYIDDIIEGTKNAIKKNYENNIFNLGNYNKVKLMDLIDTIEQEIGKKAKINNMSMQLGDVKETYADISESIKRLNYKPKISIEEGLPKFIKWYKSFTN
jgi:UDP-glucuronate 4-epimerase